MNLSGLTALDAAALSTQFTELYMALPKEYRRVRGCHRLGETTEELFVTWSNTEDSSKNFGVFIRFQRSLTEGTIAISAYIDKYENIVDLTKELGPLQGELVQLLLKLLYILKESKNVKP